MWKAFLTSGLALFFLGAVAVSSADARPWRAWYGQSYYPAYSYVGPQTAYYPPTTDYVAPEPYVAPQIAIAPQTTTSYYAPAYSTPGYAYRPYYGGYWYNGYRGRRGWRW